MENDRYVSFQNLHSPIVVFKIHVLQIEKLNFLIYVVYSALKCYKIKYNNTI